MSGRLNNEIFVFLNFLLLLSVTMFLTLCPYSLHSSLYRCSFLLALTFIYVILIFSVVEKLNDFSYFLDYRHFFGL